MQKSNSMIKPNGNAKIIIIHHLLMPKSFNLLAINDKNGIASTQHNNLTKKPSVPIKISRHIKATAQNKTTTQCSMNSFLDDNPL